MSWKAVTERHRRIVICCQGPSWRRVDLGLLEEVADFGATVIAVNGAIEIERVPARYFFTLDFSNEESVGRLARPRPGVTYYAAFPPGGGVRERLPHVKALRRISRAEPAIGPFEARVQQQIMGGLSEDPGAIHTGNSGFGALGLAYLMRPERIVFLGLDGGGRLRWDGSPNGYLDHLPELFRGAVDQLAAAGVQVANGSPGSAVDCFPVVHPDRALRWLVDPDAPPPSTR